MLTPIGQKAIERIAVFKSFCNDKEYSFLTNQIKEFDRLNTGVGFDAIQSNLKLKKIASMGIQDFLAVMWVYFGKNKKEVMTKGGVNV